ncbi:MAG: respiratory nitrate reductase subunit gamma [Nitrospirales bacterium]|nr:respiratory nitrate reductase subunit gamma [Nitrospirales bacterium]
MNFFLFALFPYCALLIAVAGGIYRYARERYSFSSFSSQLLENRVLFWGSVSFHYGIVLVLAAHILSALLSRQEDAFLLENPARLYLAEAVGTALGLLTVFGVVLLLLRRLAYSPVARDTKVMDWVLLVALLCQVVSGTYIALFERWGILWYHYTAVPWFQSLIALSPRVEFMAPLPWIVRFHAVNAFVIIALFPFTRLVHIFTVPVSYLWRPFQIIIWNKRVQGQMDRKE